MTFALVARCAETGMFGTVIASSSPAVAARCPFVAAGTGALSSQNITNPALGIRGLQLLQQGESATATIAALCRHDEHIAYRQLLAVDKNGETAVFSGNCTLGVWAAEKTQDAAAAGNLLAAPGVVRAMLDGFLSAGGHFGDRLLAALGAAENAGGEAGPVHSAGMKIAYRTDWHYIDLRCDWSEDAPLAALERAWQIYKPQADDYILRALNPAAAPAYGVAGETEEKKR